MPKLRTVDAMECEMEELKETAVLLGEEIASIEDQLKIARLEKNQGDEIDLSWVHRATTARRYKRKERAEITSRIEQLSRSIRRNSQEDKLTLFIEAAERLLPLEVYNAIWAEVGKRAICLKRHNGSAPEPDDSDLGALGKLLADR